MAQQLSDKRDIDFVIWEQLDGEAVLENEKFDEFNRKTCELIIKEAKVMQRMTSDYQNSCH